MASHIRRYGAGGLLLLLALSSVQLASGSHFRYGTLSWTTTGSGVRVIEGVNKKQVDMTLMVAYRRDYAWGENFGEEWAQTSSDSTEAVRFYGSEFSKGKLGMPGYIQQGKPGCVVQNTSATRECFDCPTSTTGLNFGGVNATLYGCTNSAPLFDLSGDLDTNENGINGESFLLKLPYLRETDASGLPTGPIRQCPDPFYCDIYFEGDATPEREARATLCQQYQTTGWQNPSNLDTMCAPWSEVYGMFWGDGEAEDVTLTVTNLVTEEQKGAILGNYLTAKTKNQHDYATSDVTTGVPFLAYFTGGDRIYECTNTPGTMSADGNCQDPLDLLLNNNAEGRFRLETWVWVHGTSDNSSPRVTMIPVIPVPRGTESMPRSRFQVAAYDPDGDELRFRFGTSHEYGGLVKSKSEGFPIPGGSQPGRTGQYGDHPLQGNNWGRNYKSYIANGTFPLDRKPTHPTGALDPTTYLDDHSFRSAVPGLIEWDTFGSPPLFGNTWCPTRPGEGGVCTKLRSGLYQFVVMVEDLANKADSSSTQRYYRLDTNPPMHSNVAVMSKVPVDFMAYLYDGPMFFSPKSKTTDATEGVATWASDTGKYGECAVCGLGIEAELGTSVVPDGTACLENSPPRFGGLENSEMVNGIVDTPEVGEWEKANKVIVETEGDTNINFASSEPFKYPKFQVFKGETVEFYVTAVDYDECTSLVLEATNLPDSGGMDARLGNYEDMSGSELNEVRRKFIWEAPAGSDTDEDLDTRDGESLVCFYAMDDYHAVANPYYCVKVLIVAKPNSEEEVLMRFDCKLSLLWNPVVQRFVFSALSPMRKYYTVCRYDNHMWHHVMVAIDEVGGRGVGQLYVDGEPAELMELTDKVKQDLNKGFDEPIGTTFETETYPNYCASATGTPDNPGFPRRKLQQNLNDFSDQPVSDAFPNAGNGVDAPTGACCSFKIGKRCSDTDHFQYQTFAGLIDEVAVWNRQLRPMEVKSTLFNMPQKTGARDLEAPRGVQLDYTAGRVLYVRFNNPCNEAAMSYPPPPSPPIVCVSVEGYECPSTRRRLLQAEFVAPDRNQYVTDKAGYGSYENVSGVVRPTDGYTRMGEWIDPMGGSSIPSLQDLRDDDISALMNATIVYPIGSFQGSSLVAQDNLKQPGGTYPIQDAIVFSDFPNNARYAFTGVPWVRPYVTGISAGKGADAVDQETALDASAGLPMDGGESVRVHGFGFARSAFTKCVLVQPDPAGIFDELDVYERKDLNLSAAYNNYYELPAESQMAKTPAFAIFQQGLGVPALTSHDLRAPMMIAQAGKCVGTVECSFQNAWWNEDVINREEAIPSFQEDVASVYRYDAVYGSWEVMECDLPAAAFPSKDYLLTVSNDAGVTGGEPLAVTIMDHSLMLTPVVGAESTFVSMPIEGRRALTQQFTVSFWVFPTSTDGTGQNLVEFGNNQRIRYNDGSVQAILGTQSSPVTAEGHPPNMWHHVLFTVSSGQASMAVDLQMVDDNKPWVSMAELKFGANFEGWIDEIKAWSTPVFLSAFLKDNMAYRREEERSANLVGYYRFNQLPATATASVPTTTVKDSSGNGYHLTVNTDDDEAFKGRLWTFAPMAVPWEAATIYSVNDVSVLEDDHITTAPATGLDAEVVVEGFNLARSFSTKCYWGEKMEMAPQVKLPASVETQPADLPNCTAPELLDLDLIDRDPPTSQGKYVYGLGEGTLGRPDGRAAAMLAYPIVHVESNVMSEATVEEGNTRLRCPSPAVDSPRFATFTAGNVPAVNAQPYEFTEVALECAGDNYVQADDVSGALGQGGYTMGAWVFPYADDKPTVMDPDMPEAPSRRRSLLSTDKNLRRKLLGHGADGVKATTTVLGFESTGGENSALLMYDGARFFYYDDCILDVTQTGPPAAAGEWHFVMVSINDEGEGVMNVDGTMRELFTTACRPELTGSFSLCQDYSHGTPANHFKGLVDEVMLFDRSMSFELMSDFMFKPYPLDVASPKKYFSFSNRTAMLPGAAEAMVDTSPYVMSTGPWEPAHVVDVLPKRAGIAGGTPVSVTGTNFARSQWLRVNFGGESVPVDAHNTAGVIAVTPNAPSCADTSGMAAVTVSNNPTTGLTPSASNVVFEPSAVDLADNLTARYTFDYVKGVTVMYDDDTMFLAPDHIGDAHLILNTSSLVPDKDLYEHSAVVFDPDNVLSIPHPGTPEYTMCAWLLMFVSEQEAPLAGAWKLVCLVADAAGQTVYINGAEQPDTVGSWYTTALGDWQLGSDEEGWVGDIWVYGRALRPCEVVARYYTQEYALDFAKEKERLLEEPATVTLPLAAGPLEFNLEMWIYAYDVEGVQTLAATDGAVQMMNTSSTELALHVGLWDDQLTFGIYRGCNCFDPVCPPSLQMTSWKSKVVPRRWQHVSFSYPFARGYAEENSMAIHVDGLLMDVQAFPGFDMPEVPEATTLDVLLGQGSTYEPMWTPFNGLMYDVRWSDKALYSVDVKTTTQCPTLHRDDTYYSLNEGGGARGGSAGAGGLRGLWTNSSYDDPTSSAATTFYPFTEAGPNELVAGDVGRFVITSRTACSKKRVVGGDEYEVTLVNSATDSEELVVEDTNDGNYHVEIKGKTCDTYTITAVSGTMLKAFTFDVVPGKTDPTKTHVQGLRDFDLNNLELNCAGTMTDFVIMAVDEAGCIQRGWDDVFVAEFDGPSKFNATVTPVEGQEGRYRVAFVPEAPGDYHMKLYMMHEGEPVAIKDGMYFCKAVCADGALSIGPSGKGVLVVEDDGQDQDLDLAYDGMTMEIWMKSSMTFSCTGDSPVYLLHKGGETQFTTDETPKTYALRIGNNAAGNCFELSASVYAGLGDVRNVTYNAASELNGKMGQWLHIAAVYDGSAFMLYIDAVLKQTETFDGFKPVNPNYYEHSLEIGTGLVNGFVDEVKLWTVARTAKEIKDFMYCAPYQEIEKVGGYFGFNHVAGNTTYGHSRQCAPTSTEALEQSCLMGVARESDTRFVGLEGNTPLTMLDTEGYNAPSAVFSNFSGPGLTTYVAGATEPTYTVLPRDKCNYVYTKDTPFLFTSQLQMRNLTWWDTRPPPTQTHRSLPFPEYPVWGDVSDEVGAKVGAETGALRECPMGLPGPKLVDEFTGYFATPQSAPTTQAGDYHLHLRVDDVLVGEPIFMTVVAGAPASFYVEPMNEDIILAGVYTGFRVQLKDQHDNTIYTQMPFTAELNLTANNNNATLPYNATVTVPEEDMVFDNATGFYTLFATLGYPGNYSLLLSGQGAADGVASVTKFKALPAMWRKLVTSDLKVPTPTRRFEHSSATYEGDIYIFGGAQYDRAYLNDMYVLRGDGGSNVVNKEEMLAYKKSITFEYVITEEKELTVQVKVNTAELITAKRMNPSCLDVMFTLPNNGEALDFYLDPIAEHPTVPGKCNSVDTLYWVKLPAGTVSPYQYTQQIDMYYGNPALGVVGGAKNEYNDPKRVFYMYEGFEDGALDDSLFTKRGDPCTEAPPDGPSSYDVTTVYPYAGQYALYSKFGGVDVLYATPPAPVTNFKLRAWFYDSDATNSSHFISPDFGPEFRGCDGGMSSMPEGMGPLEAVSTAVGTYTLSHPTKFCVASPWESTVNRYAGWHLFEVESVNDRTTVTIDNEVVKDVPGTHRLDTVMLSSGLNMKDLLFPPGLEQNHAFWDEISVALVEPGVQDSVATSMRDDEAVAMTPGREWYKVETSGATPPPRLAHSAVVYQDTMYIYGGERSAYTFSDLWAFSFKESKWTFVTPKNEGPLLSLMPEGRYDHAAAVTSDGVMIISGGRNAQTALSDVWAFDLKTQLWSPVMDPTAGAVPQPLDVGPLFSHAATIPPGSTDMYLFGGYTEGDFSVAFRKCDLSGSLEGGGCQDVVTACQVDPQYWAPDSLTKRYEATMFSDAQYVYIYGGASRAETAGFGGVYKFSISKCFLEEVPAAAPVPRYEHVAGQVDGGFYVHGGHAGGAYSDDTYYFPL